MDYTEAARRHRSQAAECRAKADLMADLMADHGTQESYLKMAAAYEAMADNEDRMAESLPKAAE
jgi:hypothetical protein